jgi:hypothetical protein
MSLRCEGRRAREPGGRAQFSEALALQAKDSSFQSLHAWINDNLAADLSVPVLAARVAMSERTFLRRYRAAPRGAAELQGIHASSDADRRPPQVRIRGQSAATFGRARPWSRDVRCFRRARAVSPSWERAQNPMEEPA